jgi:hypothetical protein
VRPGQRVVVAVAVQNPGARRVRRAVRHRAPRPVWVENRVGVRVALGLWPWVHCALACLRG